MTECCAPVSARFAIGEVVRFRRAVKDPFLAEERVREGDAGEVAHVLAGLDPVGIVVRLDTPRVPGFARIIVTEDHLELAEQTMLDMREAGLADPAAETEAAPALMPSSVAVLASRRRPVLGTVVGLDRAAPIAGRLIYS